MSYSKELQKLDSCFATSMTLTQSYALFSFRRYIKNHSLKSISSQALIAHFAKELLTFVNKHLIYELIAKVFRNSGIYMFESVHERM